MRLHVRWKDPSNTEGDSNNVSSESIPAALMWLLVVKEILKDLENIELKAVAYADDWTLLGYPKRVDSGSIPTRQGCLFFLALGGKRLKFSHDSRCTRLKIAG